MRNRRIGIVLAPLLAAAVSLAAEAGETRQPVTFSSQARIEVDAGGNVTDVRTDPKLPSGIADALRENVRQWKFAPPLAQGKPVSGVTYARVGACAAPTTEHAFALAFEYIGNGPRRKGAISPVYPKLAERNGYEGEFNLTYRVDPDGRAVVEEIKQTGPKNRGKRFFEAAIRDWIESSTFEPELVDGKPVATRMSNIVEFMFDDHAKPAPQANVEDRASCQVALRQVVEDDDLVTLDSPFRRLASN